MENDSAHPFLCQNGWYMKKYTKSAVVILVGVALLSFILFFQSSFGRSILPQAQSAAVLSTDAVNYGVSGLGNNTIWFRDARIKDTQYDVVLSGGFILGGSKTVRAKGNGGQINLTFSDGDILRQYESSVGIAISVRLQGSTEEVLTLTAHKTIVSSKAYCLVRDAFLCSFGDGTGTNYLLFKINGHSQFVSSAYTLTMQSAAPDPATGKVATLVTAPVAVGVKTGTDNPILLVNLNTVFTNPQSVSATSTSQFILGQLKSGVIYVTFKKADGTVIPGRYAVSANDLGTLGNFYRSMNMQAPSFGDGGGGGLMDVKSKLPYLIQGNTAGITIPTGMLTYKQRKDPLTGVVRSYEVPFIDKLLFAHPFTAVRCSMNKFTANPNTEDCVQAMRYTQTLLHNQWKAVCTDVGNPKSPIYSYVCSKEVADALFDKYTGSESYKNFFDSNQPQRSLDYARVRTDGTWHYQDYLQLATIDPYIQAGYAFSDLSYHVTNIPWDIAKEYEESSLNNAMCVKNPFEPIDNSLAVRNGGCYAYEVKANLPPDGGGNGQDWIGQVNPPRDMNEWGALVTHFVQTLQGRYGSALNQMAYIIDVDSKGYLNVPYDQDGDNDRNLAYQFAAHTFTVLKAVAGPGVRVANSGGLIICNAKTSQEMIASGGAVKTCNHGLRGLLRYLESKNLYYFGVARQFYPAWDDVRTVTGKRMENTVKTLVESFVQRPVNEAVYDNYKKSVTQYSFWHMPIGMPNSVSYQDHGPIMAAHRFHIITRSLQAVDYDSFSQWGGVNTARGSNGLNYILNGNGWLTMVLDSFQGNQVWQLGSTKLALSGGSSTGEVQAVAFVDWAVPKGIMISNFDVDYGTTPKPTRVEIEIPSSIKLNTKTTWKFIRYSPSIVDSVHSRIQYDLKNLGKLSSDFESAVCGGSVVKRWPLCVAALDMVSKDKAIVPDAFKVIIPLIDNNWTAGSNYVRIMQKSLTWRTLEPASIDDNLSEMSWTHDIQFIDGATASDPKKIQVTLGPNETVILKP